MYISKKIALKKTRLNSDDTSIYDENTIWKDVKAFCEKGTIYYQISNGTIGKGHRYKNYSEKAFKELMNSEATAWTLDGLKTMKELKIGEEENETK